jgi:hypothetical protein
MHHSDPSSHDPPAPPNVSPMETLGRQRSPSTSRSPSTYGGKPDTLSEGAEVEGQARLKTKERSLSRRLSSQRRAGLTSEGWDGRVPSCSWSRRKSKQPSLSQHSRDEEVYITTGRICHRDGRKTGLIAWSAFGRLMMIGWTLEAVSMCFARLNYIETYTSGEPS